MNQKFERMFIHGLFVLVDAAFNNMLIKYFFDGFFICKSDYII